MNIVELTFRFTTMKYSVFCPFVTLTVIIVSGFSYSHKGGITPMYIKRADSWPLPPTV